MTGHDNEVEAVSHHHHEHRKGRLEDGARQRVGGTESSKPARQTCTLSIHFQAGFRELQLQVVPY